VVPVAAATTSVLSDEIGIVLAAWDLHVRVTARSPNHDGRQAFRENLPVRMMRFTTVRSAPARLGSRDCSFKLSDRKTKGK
jgi:hypothetical protein